MKKLIFMLVAAAVFCSCKSREEKALELIKDDMFKTLYDFESYQPIETQLDSAYQSAYTDTTIMYFAKEAAEGMKKVRLELDKADEETNTMRIWRGLYTASAQRNFEEASAKVKTHLFTADLFMAFCKHKEDTIRTLSNAITPDFYGWKVTHKFRCKTKGGQSTIGNYVYIFDKNVKTILYKEDTESEDVIQAKKIIKEALETENSDKASSEKNSK